MYRYMCAILKAYSTRCTTTRANAIGLRIRGIERYEKEGKIHVGCFRIIVTKLGACLGLGKHGELCANSPSWRRGRPSKARAPNSISRTLRERVCNFWITKCNVVQS